MPMLVSDLATQRRVRGADDRRQAAAAKVRFFQLSCCEPAQLSVLARMGEIGRPPRAEHQSPATVAPRRGFAMVQACPVHGCQVGRVQGAREMTDLILKRAAASRPSGEWNDDDYDVLEGGAVVGRIFKVHAAPVGTPWMWTLAFRHHEDHTPTHGYEPTREGAMAAFAKSWRRV